MVFTVNVPEYTGKVKEDWHAIGKKIDAVLKEHLSGKVAIRCISMEDQPDKTVDEMIAIIQETGWDRYDSQREGYLYSNIEGKKIDFFALERDMARDDLMEQFLWSFYEFHFGDKPTRIDLILVYDLSKLDCIIHQYEDRKDIKDDGYVFKDFENKKDALLGIVRVDR